MRTADDAVPSPEAIRSLRGGASREIFARRIGVTAHTVYRWELPPDAPQSRRPTGAALDKLRKLLRDGFVPEPSEAPAKPALRESTERGDGSAVREAAEALRRGAWMDAEARLVSVLGSDVGVDADGRALALALLALIQLWFKNDARSAFTTLHPLVAIDEDERLRRETRATVHAVAALVFSAPDGRVFDPGKTNAFVRRIDGSTSADALIDVRCAAAVAEIGAALYLADEGLVNRAFAHAGPALDATSYPALGAIAAELRAHRATFSGRSAQALEYFGEAERRASAAGLVLFEVRALTFAAARRLQAMEDPAAVLALADRAIARNAGERLRPGFQTILVASVRGDALIRMGRFVEAERALQEGVAVAEELVWPAGPVIESLMDLYAYKADREALSALSARLVASDSLVHKKLAGASSAIASAACADAAGHFEAAADAYASAVDSAERAGGWPFLVRDALHLRAAAFTALGDVERARDAIRNAERFLERLPSAWVAALLRRLRAIVLLREGRVVEAGQLAEASLGTFTLGGDLPQSALSRRVLAWVAVSLGADDAERRLAETKAELRALGIGAPFYLATDAIPSELGEGRGPDSVVTPPRVGLVAPIERLCVRGVAPSLVARELCVVVGELLRGRSVRLEGVDAPSEPGTETVEFGDGSGTLVRLVMAGPLSDEDIAMVRVFCDVASLSMEVARLRGFGDRQPAPEPTAPSSPGFIAASPEMRRLQADVARLSASRSTVLLTGESGVGKEVVARLIHDLSRRRAGPFVAFNCAAVPRELFEGQLFGHRKGSFTGASSDQPGLIRSAEGGTLFLDEIGELPLDLQPKLLRFLENGEIQPLGERGPVAIDARVVAATNRELERLVAERRFREDLYYRLQVVPLHIPPLRERRDDVIALARHFVRQLGPDPAETTDLGADALAALLAYPWPGNVRELRNVIERSLAFDPRPRVLTREHLRLPR